MIDRKFLFFLTREQFKRMLDEGEISDLSIVFIGGPADEDKAIWTHGVYFNSAGSVNQTEGHAKGFFDSVLELENAYPSPTIGDWAIVSLVDSATHETKWYVCRCIEDGEWTLTEQEWEHEDVDLSLYLKINDLSQYLSDYLALNDFYNSFKTINGESILGNGNIEIASSGTEEPEQPTEDYITRLELEEILRGYAKIRWTFTGKFPIILCDESSQESQDPISQETDSMWQFPIKLIGSPCNCPKHVFLTQQQYDSLDRYRDNVLYFIIQSDLMFPIKLI